MYCNIDGQDIFYKKQEQNLDIFQKNERLGEFCVLLPLTNDSFLECANEEMNKTENMGQIEKTGFNQKLKSFRNHTYGSTESITHLQH